MKYFFKIVISVLMLNLFFVPQAFSQGWHVCVGSFKSLENAESMAENLCQQKTPAFVSESYVKSQKYYRVLLSKEFSKIEDARKFRDQVKACPFVKKFGLSGFWVCQGEKLEITPKTQKKTVEPKPVKPAKTSAKKNISAELPKIEEPLVQELPQKKVEQTPKEPLVQEIIPETPQKPAETEPEPKIPESKTEEKTDIPTEPEVQDIKPSEELEFIVKNETPSEESETEESAVTEQPQDEEPSVPEDVQEEDSISEEPLVEETAPTESPKILDKNEQPVLCEKTPYSVLVRSYKYEQFAQNDCDRLKELGFDAYLLNTFDEKTFLSFEIHSGAFKTKEEASALKEKFGDLGIFDTEISDFRKIEDKIQKYDEIVGSEQVSFDDGRTDLPACLPESVAKLVKHFPANKDFPIQEINIIDYDKYLSLHERPALPLQIFDIIAKERSVHSVLLATYRDELYEKSVSIFFANAQTFPQEDILGEVETMQFGSKDGIFECELYENKDELVVRGLNEKENLFVRVWTRDFEKEEFINLLIDSFNDKPLELYPQMRRTFFVLPDENPESYRDFVSFSFRKIGNEYASERENADWAIPIVGHSLAKTYFSQKNSLLSLGFYDLSYDFNAKKIHDSFMVSESKDFSETDKSVSVGKTEGWYLLNTNQKEISFSTKSYVVAVDTDASSPLEKEDLVSLGNDLRIWSEE